MASCQTLILQRLKVITVIFLLKIVRYVYSACRDVFLHLIYLVHISKITAAGVKILFEYNLIVSMAATADKVSID